ncbi:unnamed protein product [Vitrella brassicaformis CCMP3155]|uniref:Protein kinase domain-containing protein n=4 Tax=Vitrella brassicaformis TaxID=1169539 RepID=A0A0G4GGJ6_VITBC|nr:unnamed protein product [Vitrella brassicaformis CCMP3155]|eukprot:CEM28753.1 unnamed protein product [Vitrella brassicaformis CCMP3155]
MTGDGCWPRPLGPPSTIEDIRGLLDRISNGRAEREIIVDSGWLAHKQLFKRLVELIQAQHCTPRRLTVADAAFAVAQLPVLCAASPLPEALVLKSIGNLSTNKKLQEQLLSTFQGLSLTELGLVDCGVDDECLKTLAGPLAAMPSLNRLNVKGNSLTSEGGAKALYELVSARRSSSAFTHLALGRNRWTLESLRRTLTHCRNTLVALDISELYVGPRDSSIVAQLCRLQQLRVCKCGITSARDMQKLLSPIAPTLTHLDVSENAIGDSGVEHIAHSFGKAASDGMCVLQYIDISRVDLSAHGARVVCHLIETAPLLESIHMDGIISSQTHTTLGHAAMSRAEEHNLAKELVGALEQPSCRITDLTGVNLSLGMPEGTVEASAGNNAAVIQVLRGGVDAPMDDAAAAAAAPPPPLCVFQFPQDAMMMEDEPAPPPAPAFREPVFARKEQRGTGASGAAGDVSLLRCLFDSPRLTGTSGLIRLLQGPVEHQLLAFKLILQHACPVTHNDIEMLMQLQANHNLSQDFRYLLDTVMEELPLRNHTLKYMRNNSLDFDDSITDGQPFYDAGPNAKGLSALDYRLEWLRRHGRLPHNPPPQPARQPSTPERRPRAPPPALQESPFRAMAIKYPLHFEDGPQRVEGADCDDGADDLMGVDICRCVAAGEWEPGQVCQCRETVIVDPQTDEGLRQCISHVTQQREEANGLTDEEFVSELQDYVQSTIMWDTGQGGGGRGGRRGSARYTLSAAELAADRNGLVKIGDINRGRSRHRALLFKALCDACSIPCRLVRPLSQSSSSAGPSRPSQDNEPTSDEDEMVYNVVMFGVDYGHAGDSRDGHVERMMPVFWAPPGPAESASYAAPAAPARAARRRSQMEMVSNTCAMSLPRNLRQTLEAFYFSLNRRSPDHREVVDLDDYFAFVEQLGKGMFGEVWRVRLRREGDDTLEGGGPRARKGRGGKRDGGLELALKLIEMRSDNVPEAEIMRAYNHPRIVRLLAVFVGRQSLEGRNRVQTHVQSLCLLMELCDGSLEGLIEPPRERDRDQAALMDLDTIRKVLLDTARAMAYLHHPSSSKPHLLHRDIKPANILLKDGRALLSDFGIARAAVNLHLDANMTRSPGTEGYIAPEQRGRTYERPIDVWAFGVTIARMLGVQSWKGFAERLPAAEEFQTTDPFLKSLAINCLEKEPLLRPTFTDIVRDLLDEIFRVSLERLGAALPPDAPLAVCDGDVHDLRRKRKRNTP